MKILGIGNSAYDITILVSEYPEENKKIRLENKVIGCGGGSVSNGSYLLSKWGVDTTIASVIGKDVYGNKIEEEYRNINLNTKYLEKTDLQTPTSYIIANTSNGSRTILIDRDKLSFNNIKHIDEDFDYILADGGYVDLAYETIKNNKAISLLDAGKKSDDILKLCEVSDYIVCSNDFAKDYTNIDFSYDDINTIKNVYDKIQKDFKGLLIITLESYGAFVKLNEEYHLIPSIKVKALDSTGAGDIFHGALLYFISQGYDLLDAIKYANITGAISVTRIGGRNSIPELEEVLNYHE